MAINFKKRTETNFIVVHCSATKANQDFDISDIRQWHVKQGWVDVGYHFVIKRDGTIQEGRPIDTVGSHVRSHNKDSIGVCLIGGVSDSMAAEANFTDEQMESLKVKLKDLKALYPDAKIVGHHTLDPNKACPSFNVKLWLDSGKLLTSSVG